MKVLITGGAGFIGSTVASACLDAGITPIILDDLSTGRLAFTEGRSFYRGDIADGALLDRIIRDHPEIAGVVHCAAKIVVPESMSSPLEYYRNNVAKTIELVGHLLRLGCGRFVFSSSAALYRPGPDLTVNEASPLDPQSPYAVTKMMVERVLSDTAAVNALRVISLRYFNPIGADPMMRTGLQNPYPTHALGRLIAAHEADVPFTITGVNWPTRDGSGIRDYIHVWDLARAHVLALQRFDDIATNTIRSRVINLGTGTGTTVKELVRAFSATVGGMLNVVEVADRPGDVVGCYSRSEKAEQLLGWRAEKTLEEGIVDSLTWSSLQRTRGDA